MVEAITDTEVGVGNGVGRPMGWYDPQQGEVGDICANQVGANTTVNGFTVQKNWSQRLGACVAVDTKLSTCNGSTRPCKACTAESCSGSTPICDEDTGVCRGCTQDSDCGSGDTCNTKTGTCEGKGGPTGGTADGGAGSGSGSGSGGSGSGSGGSGSGSGSGGANGAAPSGGGSGGSGGSDGTGGDTTTQSGGCAMSSAPSSGAGVPLGLVLSGLLVVGAARRRSRAR
jgi:hypothetical protein